MQSLKCTNVFIIQAQTSSRRAFASSVKPTTLAQHHTARSTAFSSKPRRTLVVQAAKATSKGKAPAGGKGFGPAKPQKVVSTKDGCPCGSGKFYKECCKPYHTGAAVAPTVEATIRARYSAILKKNISYLLKTSHPDLHSFMYGTEPGGATQQLQDDLWNTADHYEYTNLRIRQVEPAEDPNEAIATFQYTVYDLRTPLIDDQGNKARKVQIEQSRFAQDPDTKVWQFVDFKLVEVPEALAKVAEMQAKDMAAAQAAEPAQQ